MRKRVAAGMFAGVMVACGPLAPDGPPVRSAEMASEGVVEKVTGGGQFEHPTFGTVTFSFVATRGADGGVSGRFQQHQPAFGFIYKGDVTCFAVDPVNHRAWIGGVLTHSNDPDPVTEVGDDVWFRVLDTGQGSAEPDRSTFFGFDQGVPPFDTSENYCAARPWPEGNARTWPVVHGNILIH